MAAVLMSVNERAHIDIPGIDPFPEPAVLGATSGAFFTAPDGSTFVTAQSLVGTLSFPSYLRAMRRADLARDPRFDTTQKRVENYAELHRIIQIWMRGFRDIETLDAQLDEAKIAMGQIRSMKDLAESEWSRYWGGVIEVSDRRGGAYKLHGRPWRFSDNDLSLPSAPAFRGENNRDVLLELGLSAPEVDRYVESGVLVADVPADVQPVSTEKRA
jgi:crotonobetainyl-CoA:carnitine CoA-transferase CaiB-like acyl-CoA transferase